MHPHLWYLYTRAKTLPDPIEVKSAEGRLELADGRKIADCISTKLQVMGTIAALDINNQEPSGYLNNVGRKIRHQAISRGVLLHSQGNVL